jgi:hypothetical protein
MLTSCLEVNIDVDISCMVDFSYLLCFNLHVFCSSVWACTWAQEVLRVVAEGKIPQDEPAILLSATRDDKRKAHFFTPLGKRIDSKRARSWQWVDATTWQSQKKESPTTNWYWPAYRPWWTHLLHLWPGYPCSMNRSLWINCKDGSYFTCAVYLRANFF